MNLVVTQLNYYPLKSGAGISLQRGEIGPRGFKNDRDWMIIDGQGKKVTQREIAKLALVTPSVNGDGTLRLLAEGMPPLMVPVCHHEQSIDVDVWGSNCRGIDQGDQAADWLQKFLGKPLRLLKMDPSFVRKLDPVYAPTDRDQVGFADGYPFLLIAESSLEDLNCRLKEPVPMDRFRPNIVVRGCTPFAEDNWRKIRIGRVDFHIVKPCARCVITTINQETAVSGREPLQTLSQYRRLGNKALFGQNIVHTGPGEIALGDRVEILK